MKIRNGVKKISGMVLSAVLCLSLAACGSGSTAGTSRAASAAQTAAKTTAAAAVSSAAATTKAPATTAAASSKAAAASAQGDTITVTDHEGNQVKVPKKIERIVVCDIYPLPSVLCVFFDSAKKIVGMAKPSMVAAQNSLLSKLYPDILKADTGFIKDSEINIEQLMKLKPDVVFYSASNKKQGDALKQAGIPAVAISVNKWNYNCIETLNNWISLLSQMFPENDKTAKVADYSRKVYDRIQDKVKNLSEADRKKVFFLFQYSDTAVSTSGKRFFGNWWAESVGAVNVAKDIDKDNAVQVNMEQIYKWNPQMIFITNFNTSKPDDLYKNTVGSYDWSAVDAVKNKAVVKMPLGMYRSYTPGVDTPVTLLWMAKTVYPELFKDVDITKETKDYYKTVFGIDLTDEQANTIFTPPAAAGNVFSK
jgi:iron complex transport system substrate-binding protein